MKKRLNKRNIKKVSTIAYIILSIIIILVIFYIFVLQAPKIPVKKAPPSFHEFYGSMKCSNSVSLNNKILTVVVSNESYASISTATISNDFYDVIAQGFYSNDNVTFSVDNIVIGNSNYTPFTSEEKNFSIISSVLCPSPSGGSSGGTGGSGGTGSGGGGAGPGTGGNLPTNNSQTQINQTNITQETPKPSEEKPQTIPTKFIANKEVRKITLVLIVFLVAALLVFLAYNYFFNRK